MNGHMMSALALLAAGAMSMGQGRRYRGIDKRWAFKCGLRQGVHYGVKRRKRKQQRDGKRRRAKR